MQPLNDYELWKQRVEEMRREAEMVRLSRADRGRRVQWMLFLRWELRRYTGRISKLLRN